MTLKVFAGISLRADDDVHFGALVRIHAAMAGVETDGIYAVGQQIEFQLELSDLDRSVQGVAQVRRAELQPAALNRYLLRILRMRRSDQALLQEWYQLRSTPTDAPGGGQDPQAALDSQVQSQLPEELPALPAPPRPRPVPAGASVPSRSRSFSISSSAQRAGTGRAAIRAVLLSAFAEPLPAGASTTTRRSSQAMDPSITLDLHVEPPFVTLAYSSAESWRRDWDAWLQRGLLFVHAEPPLPPLEATSQVRILFPPDLDVVCSARVVVLHSYGFGLSLDLDPATLRRVDMVFADPDLDAETPARTSEAASSLPSIGPDAEGYWAGRSGLARPADPIDAAIAALPCPLAELLGLDARQKRKLEEILASEPTAARRGCEQIAGLLRRCDWRWPDLRRKTRRAPDPDLRAAELLSACWHTRQQALQVLHEVVHGHDPTSLLELEPSGAESCASCTSLQGRPMRPLQLLRMGLPPHHISCRGRLQPARA